MNLFSNDLCPICQEPLTSYPSDKSTGRWIECLRSDNQNLPNTFHYFRPLDKSYANVFLEDFCINYVQNFPRTTISKYNKESDRYIFLFQIDQYLEIDFSNPNKTIERINNLIIFS